MSCLYHLRLPNLFVCVSTVVLFFSYVHILLSNILSVYSSTWESNINLTILQNYNSGIGRACASSRHQAVFSPPSRPGYEARWCQTKDSQFGAVSHQGRWVGTLHTELARRVACTGRYGCCPTLVSRPSSPSSSFPQREVRWNIFCKKLCALILSICGR